MTPPGFDPFPALEDTSGGVLIRVRAKPRARQNELLGVHGDALKLAIQAPPVDGKANEAIRRLLAELLDVPRRAVSLTAGGTSRNKVFRAEGLTSSEARARLAAAL